MPHITDTGCGNCQVNFKCHHGTVTSYSQILLWCWVYCNLVYDIVKKTSTRRQSQIPCIVVEKNYDTSTWRWRSHRRKK